MPNYPYNDPANDDGVTGDEDVIATRPSRHAVYRYSSYWHTWSRYLGTDSHGRTVELDLTPVNGQHGLGWDATRAGRIRRHCTPMTAGDRATVVLPDEVYDFMAQHMTHDEIHHLLTADFPIESDKED